MQQTTSALLEQLKSSDPEQRQLAIRGLAHSGDPQALDALKRIQDSDPDQNVRALASQAITFLNQQATPQASAQTPQKPAASASGNQVFQMLWDCRFCGTTKLLGVDDRHCPNCGAAQDPSWRYFPSNDDMKFISNPKYAGADKICPFCQQPNSAAAKFCKDCGGDLSGAKEAVRKQNIVTGMEGAKGIVDDVVLQKFQQEQQTLKPKGRSKLPIIIGVIVALLIALCGGLFLLSQSTYGTTAAVADMQWQHIINVQVLRAQTGSDWQSSVPSGAYNVSCHSQQRCHNESETYVCGQELVDNGDGSGTRKDKMCTRNKEVCVSDQMCNYTINRWIPIDPLKTSGGPNDPLTWANFTPSGGNSLGAQRESGRQEIFSVMFSDTNKDGSGKTYTYNPPDEATWRTFKVGQKYSVSVNRLEQVQWDTLKLVSSQ